MPSSTLVRQLTDLLGANPALPVSCLTALLALLAYTNARRARIDSLRPVLIFTLSDKWTIENIGRGPAFDIDLLIGDSSGTWYYRAAVPPIAPGTKVDLPSQKASSLSASYRDVEWRTFRSALEPNGTFRLTSRSRPKQTADDIAPLPLAVLLELGATQVDQQLDEQSADGEREERDDY